jgi:hypothetical protein
MKKNISKHYNYNAAQIRFLKNNVKDKGYKELTELFNKKYNCSLAYFNIYEKCKRIGISNGRIGFFLPGNVPHNKGKNFSPAGAEKGRFKKGNKPSNKKQVGYERKQVDGYTYVKISDKNEGKKCWKYKHVLVYEKAHGPVPEGYCVVFCDGNKNNFDLDNLALMSRDELVRMNAAHYFSEDSNITKTGIALVKLKKVLSERTKETTLKPVCMDGE